jgi:tryptophanyl-tRNA synthetase
MSLNLKSSSSQLFFHTVRLRLLDAVGLLDSFKHAASTADMLAGLKEGQEKMSKSDPDSAIFMEDDAADVKRKIKQAYCPPGVVEGNPCLDWMHYIVFGMNDTVTIKRSEANGGNL